VSDGRVRYVRNGDVRLAYRVYGDSESTLVWVPTVLSSIDRYDDPAFPWGAFVERLSREARVVVYDGRGAGLSDPVSAAPSIEDRVLDLSCVLEAAGVTQASLFAPFTGGSQSLVFAARHPDRVRSLILFATAARFTQDPPDFPWGFSQAEVTAQLEEIENHWGEGALAELVFGASADVPGVRDQWGRIQSSFAGPTMAGLLWRTYIHDDTRDILGGVRAPAIVLARRGDHMVPFEASQALAVGLPNARFAELPPGEHHAFDIADVLVEKILTFCEIPTDAKGQRVLATVLFTDIVSSTEQLSASGDEHWRHQLDVHDGVVDTVLAKHGGRRVKHTGDGVFALFDGPTGAAAAAQELIGVLATRGIRIRAGIHTGECERRGEEWSGLAVHTGARIGALAGPGEVLASRTVRDLSAGSGLIFESLGPQQLKGLSAEVDVYRVTAG
jgi:class 3 adenylate cyclase/pimeloyl-ACP methyl ester carboxylesterase